MFTALVLENKYSEGLLKKIKEKSKWKMQNIDKQKILPFEDVKQMLSLELIFNESSVSGLLVTGHCFISSRQGLATGSD